MTFKGFKIDLNWLANKLIFHSGMMATIIRKVQSSSFENEIRLWLFAAISKLSPPSHSRTKLTKCHGERLLYQIQWCLSRASARTIFTLEVDGYINRLVWISRHLSLQISLLLWIPRFGNNTSKFGTTIGSLHSGSNFFRRINYANSIEVRKVNK